MPITKASSNAVAAAAKGDLVVGNATNDSGVLAVGSTDQVLTVDSSTATGLKWATASAGGMTLLSTTSLTGASVTISSIDQTYTNLVLLIKDVSINATPNDMWYRFNGLSTSIYDGGYATFSGATLGGTGGSGTFIRTANPNSSASNPVYMMTTIPRYTSSDARKFVTSTASLQGSSTEIFSTGCITLTAAISSITVGTSSTFTAGTVYLYGVK
jgi:hypothetical protein